MPLTPSEEKLLRVLIEKKPIEPSEEAIRDVLLEKSREAGIFVTQMPNGLAKADAFMAKVRSGEVGEFLLLGIGPNGPNVEISISHNPPSYAMAELIEQFARLYRDRLHEILKAKLI